MENPIVVGFGSGGNCSRLKAILSNNAESIDRISEDSDVCEILCSRILLWELVEVMKSFHVEANPVGGVRDPVAVMVSAEESHPDSIWLGLFSKDDLEDLVWAGMMIDGIPRLDGARM